MPGRYIDIVKLLLLDKQHLDSLLHFKMLWHANSAKNGVRDDKYILYYLQMACMVINFPSTNSTHTQIYIYDYIYCSFENAPPNTHYYVKWFRKDTILVDCYPIFPLFILSVK